MKTKLLLLAAILFGFMSQSQVVHLTGAGVGGWNNPPLAQNLMSTTDNINYTLSNIQITGSGGSAEFKFMIDSNWGTTYGSTSSSPWTAAGTTGVAGAGGGNIAGVAGFWNVSYKLTTGDYNITPGVNPNAVINITSSGAPVAMVTSNGVNYSSPSVVMAAGPFLFAQAGSANQWGNAAFPSGTATLGGTGVNVPAGVFNIAFNKNTGEYSFTRVVVGMIGAGSPSGSWGADAPMTVQPDGYTYKITNANITGGTMKIRDDASWTFQFGTNGPASSNTFPSGVAIPNGNDMLTVTGNYDITFNRSNGEYNFAPALSSSSFTKSTFVVSPNPTNTAWKIASPSESIQSVQIIDVLGKVVYVNNNAANEINVDATGFNNGIYFAKINSGESVNTIKLVRN